MRLESLSLNEPGVRTIMPFPGGWELRARNIESATLQWVGWARGSVKGNYRLKSTGRSRLPFHMVRGTMQYGNNFASRWLARNDLHS